MLIPKSVPGGVRHRSSPATASLPAAVRCCRPSVARPQRQRQVVSSSAQDTDQQLDEAVAEAAARAGWDPHGLLPPVDGPVDHFTRRARLRQQQQQQNQPEGQAEEQQQPAQQSSEAVAAAERTAAPAAAAPAHSAYTTAVQQQQAVEQQLSQQQLKPAPLQQQQEDASGSSGPVRVTPAATAAFAPSDPVQRIPAVWLKQGGIPASDPTAYDRQSFLEKLATKFIPIDLDFPGLRIVNFDPAIFTVEGFMSREECQQWQQAALDSGCLQQSKIGAGNAAAGAGAGSVNVYGARRTSSSLLMDAATQAQAPALASIMRVMQGRATKLLAHLDNGRSWGPAGKMPAGGQYCFEHPQVARYTTGQHFLAHEDGFPPLLATANGFQRHATLLLYLNDVQQGGATHFDHLGVSIQPRQGMALLFFPAYASGTPDARTLHTAQDAADTKWVMQQWIARGYPTPKAVLKAVKVAALAGPESDVTAAAEQQQQQPLEREVFKVVASSSSGSGGDGYGGGPSRGKAKKANKKGSGSKKGFSRR